MSTPQATVHAQQAFELSDVFKFKFDPIVYGRRRPRRLEMSKPDGPSTSGGRVARQNLVLTPIEEGNGSPIVVGWVDVTNRRAELRSFRMLGKQFEARHNRGIDLEADTYDKLEQELQSFMDIQRIVLGRADTAPAPAHDAVVETGPRESSGPMFAMLALGILLGLGIGYIVFGS